MLTQARIWHGKTPICLIRPPNSVPDEWISNHQIGKVDKCIRIDEFCWTESFPAISSVKLELPVEILTLYFLPTCTHPFLGHPIVCRKRVLLLLLRIALLTGTWAHKPSPVLKEKKRGRIIITGFWYFLPNSFFPPRVLYKRRSFRVVSFDSMSRLKKFNWLLIVVDLTFFYLPSCQRRAATDWIVAVA